MTHAWLSETDLIAPHVACALQQHPRYGAAVRALGGTVMQLCSADQTALVLRRRLGPVPVLWLPRGPVTLSGASPEPLLSALPRGCLTAMPDRADDLPVFQARGFRAVFTPQHVAELDLTPPMPQRLAAQHGKWRNRLRRAQDGPLRVTYRPLDPTHDMGLLQLEETQRRDRRYAAFPRAFTLAYAATAKDAALLFLAHHGTQVAGFVLVLLHAPVATYHIGWTAPAGRRHGAHPLLLWQASNRLAEMGYSRLDLGALDTENTPGLARFKLGIGATARALGPTLLRLPGLTRTRHSA